MNDPDMADQRYQLVSDAKKQGIPKDEAWSTIQHEWTDVRFEGHLLEATIDHVYDDE